MSRLISIGLSGALGVAGLSLVAASDPLPPDTTYRPLPSLPLSEVKQNDEAQKPRVMERQRSLLEQRYDLPNRPIAGARMSGGRKAVQDGVRVKLPPGETWDSLSGKSAIDIRDNELLPSGFLPCRTSSMPPAARSFRNGRSRKSHRRRLRDLRRFDVEFDLPDHLTPEFPPPIFLTTHPELGDVSRGELLTIRNFYEIHERHRHARSDGGLAPAADALSAGRIQSDRGPQGRGAKPGRGLSRLSFELSHQCGVSPDARRTAASRALPPRYDQPARPVQPADPRFEAVAALGRGFHRVRAAHRLFQRRPCQRHAQGRASARPPEPGGDDGADAEHHRLSASAEARSVGSPRSRQGQRTGTCWGSRSSSAKAAAPNATFRSRRSWTTTCTT